MTYRVCHLAHLPHRHVGIPPQLGVLGNLLKEDGVNLTCGIALAKHRCCCTATYIKHRGVDELLVHAQQRSTDARSMRAWRGTCIEAL